jgi:hypothetical protein
VPITEIRPPVSGVPETATAAIHRIPGSSLQDASGFHAPQGSHRYRAAAMRAQLGHNSGPGLRSRFAARSRGGNQVAQEETVPAKTGDSRDPAG